VLEKRASFSTLERVLYLLELGVEGEK